MNLTPKQVMDKCIESVNPLINSPVKYDAIRETINDIDEHQQNLDANFDEDHFCVEGYKTFRAIPKLMGRKIEALEDVYNQLSDFGNRAKAVLQQKEFKELARLSKQKHPDVQSPYHAEKNCRKRSRKAPEDGERKKPEPKLFKKQKKRSI